MPLRVSVEAGGTVVLAPDPSPISCFPLIARHRVNLTSLVPPAVSLWLQAAESDPSVRSQIESLALLQVGGAKLAEAVARKITPLLGCRLQQVFGMAEGLVNYTRLDDPDDKVIHTQGRPMSPDDEVRILDEAGNPVQAHLGLSLFDRTYQNELNPENMLSYCHLSTEIKGNIHNPAYYFDSNNKDRLAAFDLLLLTQGWRRYVWEKADSATLADCFLSDEIKGKQIIGKKKTERTGERRTIDSGFRSEHQQPVYHCRFFGKVYSVNRPNDCLEGRICLFEADAG